jgi:hypothetical protein
VNSLAEACKLFEDVESGSDQEYFDDGEYAREKSLTMDPLGELPRKDDLSLPKDSMAGFRGKNFPYLPFLAGTRPREHCRLLQRSVVCEAVWKVSDFRDAS